VVGRLVFRLLEVRQHAGPVPALAAALAPAVIIGGMAAHVDHAIEGTGAAQHLAARLIGGAVVESGDRFALELPVVAGVGVEFVVTERNVDPWIAVAPPRLEQQHPIASGFGEPRGDGAAGRTGTGDDVVEGFGCHGVPWWRSPCKRRWQSRRAAGSPARGIDCHRQARAAQPPPARYFFAVASLSLTKASNW